MINIVVPMAGAGSRFINAGYKKPKPFIDILGKPMIKRVLENLNYEDANYIFILRQEHTKDNQEVLDDIKQNCNATFIYIDKLTEGAACTVLFAHKLINNDHPLLIANSDQIVDICIKDYINNALDRKLDGSILTFEDNEPKWSYAKVDKDNLVTEVKEKKVISNYATVGIYFYTKGMDFVNSSIDMIVNNDRVNNEFYVCPVYNYLIKQKGKIGIYNIKKYQMHGTGTPNDLNKYIKLIQKC
jgi:UDP-N-acetylglucosamine diphosphorylase / glucose-1-phosphate thymidylyltransferase / UDP-N-acetylgalactosamine diphosphorylase / glucosamine-1-phosphate N-acetyltransferase / galactosamine-1-phosphate N-acetyltransferase